MALRNGREDSRSSECTMTAPPRLTMDSNPESANEAVGEGDDLKSEMAVHVGRDEVAEAGDSEDGAEETEAGGPEGEEEEDGERAISK